MVAVQRWQQQQTAELLVPLQLWFDARCACGVVAWPC